MTSSNAVGRLSCIGMILVAACASESKGSAVQQSATLADSSVLADPTCDSRSVEETRDTLPQGACTKDVECEFTTRGGVENCKPGQRIIAGDTEWRCTCPAGEWKCDVLRGGFGVQTCPGAVDAGAE